MKTNLKTKNDFIEYWTNFGMTLIPCKANKQPIIKFAENRNERKPEGNLEVMSNYMNSPMISGLTDNGLFVLDADSEESESALAELERNFNMAPSLIVYTKRGEHHYFRLPPGITGIQKGYGQDTPHKIDIRSGRSMIMLPFGDSRRYEIDITNSAANHIDELTTVSLDFFEAVYRHNDETPPNRVETSKTLRQEWNGSQREIDETVEMLSFIDPNIGHNHWFAVLSSIVSKFGNSDEALEIADAWCRKGTKYKSRIKIEEQLDEIKPDGGINIGTLYHYASKAGANIQAIKGKHKEPATKRFSAVSDSNCKTEKFNSFDDALEYLTLNTGDGESEQYCIDCIRDEKSATTRKRLIEKFQLVTRLTKQDIKDAIKKSQPKSLSHAEIAVKYQGTLSSPVCVEGKLWTFESDKNLYEASNLQQVAVNIGNIVDKESLCRTQSAYKQIAENLLTQCLDESFFDSAPLGILTLKGFYTVEDKKVVCVAPEPHHKARYMVDVLPKEIPIPLFMGLLKDAFGDSFSEQSRQLQQALGLVLFGLQYKTQKCVFLKGEAGSGKSLILKLIEEILPSESVTSVSPIELDDIARRTMLAGKVANLCGEISKTSAIPSAEFKMLTGSDSITAKYLFMNPFTFTSKAGNWFNGNFYLSTKDRTEGFWRRWWIINFKHGKQQEHRDPELLDKIIKSELSGVLYWAFCGLEDYLNNGIYESPSHFECMNEWKIEADSVLAWLSYENIIQTKEVNMYRRSNAYEGYRCWCSNNGYHYARKRIFFESMTNAGYTATKSNGEYYYKFIKPRQIITLPKLPS